MAGRGLQIRWRWAILFARPREIYTWKRSVGWPVSRLERMELKLTNVARASLEELRLDYEDYLRHHSLPLWPKADPRRAALVARRCATADEVAEWVKEVHGCDGQNGPDEQPKGKAPSMKSIPSIQSTYPEIAANAALVLIGVACALLDRQLEAQAAAFTEEGGFTERLHRIRTERRRYSPG